MAAHQRITRDNDGNTTVDNSAEDINGPVAQVAGVKGPSPSDPARPVWCRLARSATLRSANRAHRTAIRQWVTHHYPIIGVVVAAGAAVTMLVHVWAVSVAFDAVSVAGFMLLLLWGVDHEYGCRWCIAWRLRGHVHAKRHRRMLRVNHACQHASTQLAAAAVLVAAAGLLTWSGYPAGITILFWLAIAARTRIAMVHYMLRSWCPVCGYQADRRLVER